MNKTILTFESIISRLKEIDGIDRINFSIWSKNSFREDQRVLELEIKVYSDLSTADAAFLKKLVANNYTIPGYILVSVSVHPSNYQSH